MLFGLHPSAIAPCDTHRMRKIVALLIAVLLGALSSVAAHQLGAGKHAPASAADDSPNVDFDSLI
jgi:hypothetical protein